MTTEMSQLNSPVDQVSKLVAVIDIGATSIRMAIAEIQPDASVRVLENLSQAVSLGKDSFARGKIDRKTIEDCVNVLAIYRQKLKEYRIKSNDQIRVVATSAVREAANRLAFQDRVFIATGFEIEPFDAAELHRVTYLGILPFLEKLPQQDNADDRTPIQNVVCEIGGGSTEMLVLQGTDILFSRTFRTGSLRLRQTLEAFHVPIEKMRQMMQSQVDQIVTEIQGKIDPAVAVRLIVMGGDIRFLATEILKKNPASELADITLTVLENFNTEIAAVPPEKLTRQFSLSNTAAQSLSPALLAYEMIARGLGVESLLVANANLRDGLITEMGMSRVWSESIEKQIIHSAVSVGRRYNFDEAHAQHVAELARQLFDELTELHQLEKRFGAMLYIASLLHEIGLFVSLRSNHKHSMYLIRNSEFFGIGEADLRMIALIARYHRGAFPQSSHEGYSVLNRKNRVAVSKLAALLRVAKALDAQRSQRIKKIDCQQYTNRVVIRVQNVSDSSLEYFELNQNSELFETVYGRRVILENVPNSSQHLR